jgi:hypothetical protein
VVFALQSGEKRCLLIWLSRTANAQVFWVWHQPQLRKVVQVLLLSMPVSGRHFDMQSCVGTRYAMRYQLDDYVGISET